MILLDMKMCMIGNKKIIIIFTVAIFIIAVFLYWHSLAAPAQKNPDQIYFMIEKGDGVKLIAKNLRSAGLIKSDLYFKYYVWRTNNQANFKAGEYVLNPASSVKEIVGVLAGGKTVSREKEIKILEGWDIADIDKYLLKNNINGFADFARKKTGNWTFQFAKPQILDGVPSSADLEGFLFPDTYRVFNDVKAEDVIEKMVSNFDKKLSGNLRQEIAAQGKTVDEIIIMASIIEKEVSKEEDRMIVSGILYKRLELAMLLGVDSTINYITGKNNPQANYDDLKIDSPYNTYKYRGLPPGPICNPSLSSIKAAVYPVASPYLYYLNRQDTGGTIFSKTYDEHLKNKAKYLK